MYASEGCAGSRAKRVARRPAAGHFLSAAPVIICDSASPAFPGGPSGAPSLSAMVTGHHLSPVKPYTDRNTLDATPIGPAPQLQCSTSRTRLDFGPLLEQDHGS